MIKKIKEIDLYGNVTLREVMVCNKCGEMLEGEDYVYTLKPYFRQVNPKRDGGYGWAKPPDWHLCNECFWKLYKTLDERKWHE